MTRSPLTALRRPGLRRAAVPALLAGALVLAGCGTQVAGPGGSGSPTSPVPSAPATVTTLDAARAAWSSSPASTGEYQLTIVQQCFCPGISLTVVVKDGKVVEETATSTDNSGGAVAPTLLEGFPRTVEDLHGVVAGSADAASSTVTYDRRGVPLRIWIDQIENAADDEHGYSVTFATASEDLPAPDASSTWAVADPPAGASFPADFPQPGQGNAQAMVVTAAGGSQVYLGLWGSGSCPDVPTSLRIVGTTLATGRQPAVVTAVVDVDATVPPATACTDDYGPTVYAADLPADVAAELGGAAGARLVLVLEVVTGIDGDTGSASYAVDALPV
ncbi:DUF6174 domain-containing protein [Longivirga aurantiaca]|uniref:DUF6174 domain-containing protein n=1 Tax=Longivirga aurantiaca TaxID=1837743 RepID=A0ABW1T1U1_9ACTN